MEKNKVDPGPNIESDCKWAIAGGKVFKFGWTFGRKTYLVVINKCRRTKKRYCLSERDEK